jgi:hypothetical protein
VTEAEWLGRDKPADMLMFLREELAGREGARRKIRLWVAACCRQVWHRLTNPRSRKLVEASERYADGEADFRDLKAAWDANGYAVGPEAKGVRLARSASHRDIWQGALESWAALKAPAVPGNPEPALGERAQAGLFREVFGNPFRRVVIATAGKTPQVVALAQVAYEKRELPAGTLDLARLLVLADALEDAGCDQPDLLGHLRGPGAHVRGCWALDLLLGKE